MGENSQVRKEKLVPRILEWVPREVESGSGGSWESRAYLGIS